MLKLWLFSVFVFSSMSAYLCSEDDHHEHEMMIEPFELTKKLLKVHTVGMTLANIDTLISQLYGRIHCVKPTDPSSSNTCKSALCMAGSVVFNYLGVAAGKEILESDFGNLTNLLAYHLLTAKNNCGQTITSLNSKLFYKQQLIGLFTKGGASIEALTKNTLQEVLTDFDDVYDHDDHEHNSGDHDNDHTDDHTDDHDHATTASHDDHDNDHSHTEDENDHSVTMPSTTSDHDDSHEDHSGENSSENDDDDHDVDVHVQKCLSAGRLYDELYKDTLDKFDDDDIGSLSQLLVYHVITGHKISRECRLIPGREYIENGLMQYLHATNDTVSKTEFNKMLGALKLVSSEKTTSSETEDSHDGHDHRRKKRSVEHEVSLSRRSKRSVTTTTFASKCYSADELLAIYNTRRRNTISKADFLKICPSLIYQQVTDACAAVPKNKTINDVSTSQKYGYGTLAVFIVCLCSIAAVFLFPCSNRTCVSSYNIILATFLGLAVGTLTTDAVLHLIPAAFGLHDHSEDEHNHDHGGIAYEPYMGYGLAAIAGMYVFYFVEMVFNLLSKKDGGHGHSHLTDLNNMELDTGNIKNGKTESKSELYKPNSDVDFSDSSDLGQTKVKADAKSLIVMVLVGDALHNFADGLAIGAGFSASVPKGLATTITVFCHELPHELGDFAILVASGLSFQKALLFNFLSSLTAFAGLYIGIAISTDEGVRNWIFAITAGLFLYIALSDMMPTLTSGGQGPRRKRIQMIIFNNIGIFVGVLILVLISLYEGQIKV